ncbi:MAG TPA: hypothetical protein VFF67_02480 [Thermoplasmata archaeon]|nr:hypothetical protein [Thermoplasmata archaeon]
MYASAGAAVAVALLMAASPLAGALKPHVIVPPYKGSTSVVYRSVSSYGSCKSSVALTGVHWVPKTGNATGFGYASAKGCATPPIGNGNSQGYTSAEFEIGIPIKVATNLGHNISVDVSYVYTVIATVTGKASCPVAKNVPGVYTYSDCSVYASAGSSVSMEFWDQTNGSFLYGQNDYAYLPQNYSQVYNYSYCNGAGTCYNYNSTYACHNSTYSVCVPSGTRATGSNTTWINTGRNCEYGYNGFCYYWRNWTLNSSHKYWVIEYVNFDANADIYGYGAGHGALATVNGATLGNSGWRIASVTVT